MSTTIPRGAPHALTPISTSRLRLRQPFCGASSFGRVVGSQTLPARRSSNSGSVAVATPVDTQHAPRQNGTHRQSTPSAGQASGPGAPGKRIVVVGGGWAGFGAAKHLSQEGYSVTLIDGSPNPGGLSAGWRTDQGRAVEAGVKGFWYQYHNIFALVKEMGIPHPFTDWTTSGFWSPRGLTTEAPVFSKQQQYPTLLGQFIHTFPLFRSIPLADRLTMLPLLYSILDYDRTPATYEQYDKMSAWELFQR